MRTIVTVDAESAVIEDGLIEHEPGVFSLWVRDDGNLYFHGSLDDIDTVARRMLAVTAAERAKQQDVTVVSHRFENGGAA